MNDPIKPPEFKRFDQWELDALERAGCTEEVAKKYNSNFTGFEIACFFTQELTPEDIRLYLSATSGPEIVQMIRQVSRKGINPLLDIKYGNFAITYQFEKGSQNSGTGSVAQALKHSHSELEKTVSGAGKPARRAEEEADKESDKDADKGTESEVKGTDEDTIPPGQRLERIAASTLEIFNRADSIHLLRETTLYCNTMEIYRAPPELEYELLKIALREKLGGELTEELGCGSHGKVYRLNNGKADFPKAVKIIPQEEFEAIKKEVDILYSLSREGSLRNMPRLNWIDGINTGIGEYCYILMDYIKGRPLGSVIKENTGRKDALPYRLVELYSAQMIDCIETLQAKSIVHGDINIDNILITDEDKLYFIDFGTARKLDEVLAGNKMRCNRRFGPPCQHHHNPDIFALGHLMFSMLSGRTLFTKSTEIPQEERETITKTRDKYFYDTDGNISQRYLRLIRRYVNKHNAHIVKTIEMCLGNTDVRPEEVRELIFPSHHKYE